VGVRFPAEQLSEDVMSIYSLALFAHLLGVLGLFAGLSLDWISLLRLRQAQTLTQVREATGLSGIQARLLPLAVLVLLVAGIYMTATTWGWGTPWILVSLAGLVLIGVLANSVSGRRLRAIERAANTEGSSETLPAALRRQIADPILLTALQTAVVIGVGVVFLMTTKPDLFGSLLTMAGAIVLGVSSALLWQLPRAGNGRGKEFPGFGERSQ
jgi:uncharacterized membrane protein